MNLGGESGPYKFRNFCLTQSHSPDTALMTESKNMCFFEKAEQILHIKIENLINGFQGQLGRTWEN